MVIGLYLHSKTNRHSAEAAPGWLHPLNCDHGVGGTTQCNACTWVCRGACWPLSSAYQLTHSATLIEIAAELPTVSTLSTASVFQVMHMFLMHCITRLHLKHDVAFTSSGGQCQFIHTPFPQAKSLFDCQTGNTQCKVVHICWENHQISVRLECNAETPLQRMKEAFTQCEVWLLPIKTSPKWAVFRFYSSEPEMYYILRRCRDWFTSWGFRLNFCSHQFQSSVVCVSVCGMRYPSYFTGRETQFCTDLSVFMVLLINTSLYLSELSTCNKRKPLKHFENMEY